MVTKPVLIRLAIAGAVLAGATAVALAQAPASSSQGMTVGGNITKPLARPAGQMSDSSKWSATTYEAATSEEHREMLERGRRVRVTGEVVDISCYLQLGKHGAAHVACATKCATNGQPIGLLTTDRTLYFLFPEEHHPRRDGQAEIRTTLIPLMGKAVTLSGTATLVRGSRGLFLNSAELGNIKVVEGGEAK